MPLVTDPDDIDYELTYTGSKEMFVDLTNKKVQLIRTGNLSSDGITLKAVYSKLKDIWLLSTEAIKYPFPMTPITDEQFEFKDGWNFDKTGSGSDFTPNLIRTGGWAVKNTSNATIEMWAGIITLGSIQGGGQVYSQQESSGSAINFNLTGPVNQAIQIFRDDDGDGNTAEGSDYDRRAYLKLFLRTQGNIYANSQLSDIGVTSMTYQVYRFPLSDSDDTKITTADVGIDADSNGTADVAPYSGMSITWYVAAQTRSIGGVNRDFHVIINGNNGTAEQIYEFVQWSLRQSGDIDAGAGTKTGKLTNELLRFVGSDLYTRLDSTGGVYIDNFQVADTNRLHFTDDTGTERTFPYVAVLTINFGDNLKNDPAAEYRVFFTNDDAGSNLGYDYGTANAITVNDNSSNPMTGNVSAASSVQLTFNYDGNVQRGGGSAGTNAPITVVGIGESTGQFVSATGTITRSTSNSVSLVAALERNYQP